MLQLMLNAHNDTDEERTNVAKEGVSNRKALTTEEVMAQVIKKCVNVTFFCVFLFLTRNQMYFYAQLHYTCCLWVPKRNPHLTSQGV